MKIQNSVCGVISIDTGVTQCSYNVQFIAGVRLSGENVLVSLNGSNAPEYVCCVRAEDAKILYQTFVDNMNDFYKNRHTSTG